MIIFQLFYARINSIKVVLNRCQHLLIYNCAASLAQRGWLSMGGRTLQLLVLKVAHLGGIDFTYWIWRISTHQGSTTDTFYSRDDPSIREKYSTQGSGAPCHVSFGFFARFLGIRLAKLQVDPQLESTIRTKARGLHSIWNAIFQITISIWFFNKTTWVLLKTFERSTRERLRTTWEDFNTTQRLAVVPSNLWMCWRWIFVNLEYLLYIGFDYDLQLTRH
jgi:hypothetical protein